MDILNECGITDDRQGEPEELPVGLLHGLKGVVADLEAGWCVGTSRNTSHIYLCVSILFCVLKDWLVLGVPEGYWPIHITVQHELFIDQLKQNISFFTIY